MNRRDFARTSIGAAVITFGVHPARAGTHRVDCLDYGTQLSRSHLWAAFRDRLRENGYVDGRNIDVTNRFADGEASQLGELTSTIVSARPDVIVTAGTPATQAVARAISDTPIVMVAGGNPTGMGLIGTLARPGTNITGIATQTEEASVKRVDLLRELNPRLERLGLVWDAHSAFSRSQADEVRKLAGQYRIHVVNLKITSAEQIGATLDTIAVDRVDALIVMASSMLFGERHRLATKAISLKLPLSVPQREYAEAGGLFSYASNLSYGFRRGADYVDRLLRGARPENLPIEQPTKFELVINNRTASALRIDVPLSLLARADEVIE